MQEFRYLIAVQLFTSLCQKEKSMKEAGKARAVQPHGVAQGREGCIWKLFVQSFCNQKNKNL